MTTPSSYSDKNHIGTSRWPRSVRYSLALLLFLVTIAWLFVPPIWKLKGGYTSVVQWQRNVGARIADVGPQKPGWIAANNVSKHVLYAFVVAEDGRFYEHCGLDFYEIWQSMQTNWRQGRYVRGGSTISQQVIKMAFLSRDKTLTRKFREATGALLVELLLSKNEIIEWYINLAEFGDGIYGLRAAAKHYFQTKPELLTIQQAAHLAVVLPSPNGWSVGLRKRNLTHFGQRRYAQIVTHMKLAGYITEAQWMNALATGNFGRPVIAYERILSRANAHTRTRTRSRQSSASSEDLPQTTSPSAASEEAGDLEDLLESSSNVMTPEELKTDSSGESDTESPITSPQPSSSSEALASPMPSSSISPSPSPSVEIEP